MVTDGAARLECSEFQRRELWNQHTFITLSHRAYCERLRAWRTNYTFIPCNRLRILNTQLREFSRCKTPGPLAKGLNCAFQSVKGASKAALCDLKSPQHWPKLRPRRDADAFPLPEYKSQIGEADILHQSAAKLAWVAPTTPASAIWRGEHP
jgi:hypothetical protein